jgi:hypothetical protein
MELAGRSTKQHLTTHSISTDNNGKEKDIFQDEDFAEAQGCLPDSPCAKHSVCPPTHEFLTANVPVHVHGNFVPPTPSEKKALAAHRFKHHQTFCKMLAVKFFIEPLEKSDKEANHKGTCC